MHNQDRIVPDQNGLPFEEREGGKVQPELHKAGEQEELWSSPQFSLKTLMGVVTTVAVLCSLFKTLNIHWYVGFLETTILALLGWLAIGCWRIVKLSGQDRPDTADAEETTDDLDTDKQSDPNGI